MLCRVCVKRAHITNEMRFQSKFQIENGELEKWTFFIRHKRITHKRMFEMTSFIHNIDGSKEYILFFSMLFAPTVPCVITDYGTEIFAQFTEPT